MMFNRPDLAGQIFEAIRQQQPSRLYLAVDGPRVGREGEAEAVQACRDLASQVDWECEVFTQFQESNLGCGRGVRSAIDWFFNHEEEGIILEDDTLPSPDFFKFTGELLEKYRDDTRVMSIAGYSDLDAAEMNGNSYDFTIYNLIWGWATWRRAWELHKFTCEEMSDALQSDWFYRFVGSRDEVASYWRQHIRGALDGSTDTWDYQWRMSLWMNHGLSILPCRNLVQNIGFDERATHTTVWSEAGMQRTAEALEFPLKHPVGVRRDYDLDRQLEIERFRIKPRIQPKFSTRALNKLRRMAKLK